MLQNAELPAASTAAFNSSRRSSHPVVPSPPARDASTQRITLSNAASGAVASNTRPSALHGLTAHSLTHSASVLDPSLGHSHPSLPAPTTRKGGKSEGEGRSMAMAREIPGQVNGRDAPHGAAAQREVVRRVEVAQHRTCVGVEHLQSVGHEETQDAQVPVASVKERTLFQLVLGKEFAVGVRQTRRLVLGSSSETAIKSSMLARISWRCPWWPMRRIPCHPTPRGTSTTCRLMIWPDPGKQAAQTVVRLTRRAVLSWRCHGRVDGLVRGRGTSSTQQWPRQAT